LLVPLFLALGMPLWGWFILVFLMLIAKWFVFLQKSQKFYQGAGVNWSYLIAYEERRKQTILRFFALFTNVKGISNSVKRRAYLDGLTNILPKRQSTTWQNIYLRSYLRNGDFLALTIRLLFLSLLGIGFISQSWIAAIFVALLNYLLLFQLTALYNAFDYQYLTFLFPLETGLKLKGVKQVIILIGYSVLFVETIMALLFFQDRVALLFMIGITLLLYFIYLPFKLRSLVD
uniref:ABC transporter permease n=2 Tax=Streptococcus TaxID=1301 RepID=UPI004026470B